MKSLTTDEKILLVDNKDTVAVTAKVMVMIMDRHIEKLLSETVDGDSPGKLVVIKSKLDGMKEMIREYEQLVSKIIRS